MKNYLLLMLFYCILNIACTNKKEVVDYKKLNENEANAIVSYNNAVVELTDEQTNYLSKMEGSLARIQEGLDNPSHPTAFLAIMPIFSATNFYQGNINPEIPPDEVSSEDQSFFKTKIKKMKTDFATIKLLYASLNDYVKAEDYKDDDSNRGNGLVDSIYDLGNSYYNSHGEMLKRLKIIGDVAERVLLKTDPLKDYIFALKADRKAVGEFYDLMGNGVEDYLKIATQARAKYKQLEKMQRQHSQMDIQKIRNENGKEQIFIEFYQRFNELLIAMRKLMRNAAETGKIKKFELEELAGQGNSMRNVYNNFVD